ncbi:hypothetical protein D3C72_947280 [compost metagenome]
MRARRAHGVDKQPGGDGERAVGGRKRHLDAAGPHAVAREAVVIEQAYAGLLGPLAQGLEQGLGVHRAIEHALDGVGAAAVPTNDPVAVACDHQGVDFLGAQEARLGEGGELGRADVPLAVAVADAAAIGDDHPLAPAGERERVEQGQPAPDDDDVGVEMARAVGAARGGDGDGRARLEGCFEGLHVREGALGVVERAKSRPGAWKPSLHATASAGRPTPRIKADRAASAGPRWAGSAGWFKRPTAWPTSWIFRPKGTKARLARVS